MVQATQISETISLYDLRVDFGLEESVQSNFFNEWQEKLPDLSDLEQRLLDRVKQNFVALTARNPISENLVKMTVVSPLLDLANFYRIEYEILDEASIEINATGENDIVYRGRIDILVIQNQFWLAVIEAKHSKFSLINAIPQALAYMLASPHPDKPVFGLVTNGSEFRFLKLINKPTPQYAFSKLFSIIDPGNDLHQVLQVIKSIADSMQVPSLPNSNR